MRVVSIFAVASLVTVGVPSPLAAQYPNVPPPVPCLRGDASEGVGLTEVGVVGRTRRLAIEPFRSTLSEGDSANAALAAAFSSRVAARLAPVQPVQLWTPFMDDAAPAARIVALGQATQAQHLLVGRVVPADRGGIALSIRLYETTHGGVIWTRTFTGKLTDLVMIEDTIADGVAARVRRGGPTPARSAAGPAATSSPVAYLRYLEGEAELTSRARHAGQRAMEDFSSAVQLDSMFAAAWSGLAFSTVTYIEREGTASPDADTATISRAMAAAQRATTIAPRSAEAWTARGAVLELHEPRSHTGALAAYRKAIELDARDADAHRRYAEALLDLGAYGAGAEQLRQALADAPGDPLTLVAIGGLHLRERRYRDACHALDVAVLSDPLDADAYAVRAFARLRLHDIRGAWVDAETGARLGAWLPGSVAAIAAHSLARDTATARARMTSLVAAMPEAIRRPTVWESSYLAQGYLALGKDARAVELVAHATPRGAALWYALQDPAFDRLRGDAQLEQVLNDSRPTVASAP